jgi:fucose 4-O-acetylase-like acetyltransferase
MSELQPTSHAPTPVQPSAIGRRPSLVKIGGSLGMAAAFISMAVFLAGLCDFEAAFMLAPLALALAIIGFIVTIIGGVMRTYAGNEETQPLAAFFVCIIGIVASLIEIYIAMGAYWITPK